MLQNMPSLVQWCVLLFTLAILIPFADIEVGVKRTWNFGLERTHVLTNKLERIFSPDFQV